ncbi:MAG TPA: sensor histidine kinase, partial [Actinomycetes bacterium]
MRGWPAPVVDGLLAIAAGWLAVVAALGDARRGAHLPTLGVVLLLALVPALWVRRRWPAVTLVMVVGIQAGLFALRVQPSANYLVEMAAPYSVALYGSRRVQRVVVAAAGVALLGLALPLRWLRPSDRGAVFGLLVGGAVAWLVGNTIRERRERFVDLEDRAARLERERDLEAGRAVAEERLRIARELHDVVAHNLSVVVVQAQAAQRMLDLDTERTRTVVASIEGTGREALEEMRQLLGVLRGGEPGDPEDGADGEFDPQPRLARLGELVEQMRAAGLPVTLRVEGAERPLGAAADLSAFRIVQEALTNTLKHAGPARAEVVLSYGERDLELTVRDDGRGLAAALDRDQDGAGLPSSGHGLVGMRERVALFGGELAAGPRPGGGYQI